MRFSTDIGCFEIDSLPSQVQVGVCHGFFVYEHKRGQGLAVVLHAQQLAKLVEKCYDFAICTVTGDNPAQSRAIAKAGWTLDHTFYNSRLHPELSGNDFDEAVWEVLCNWEDDSFEEPEDTPCLESGRDNCNDFGTGEGQFHGRL